MHAGLVVRYVIRACCVGAAVVFEFRTADSTFGHGSAGLEGYCRLMDRFEIIFGGKYARLSNAPTFPMGEGLLFMAI